MKTSVETVYIGHPGGFVLDMDANQNTGGGRLEAKFGWQTEDPFHWPIVRLRSTEFASPS
jgi:hypothetical protein